MKENNAEDSRGGILTMEEQEQEDKDKEEKARLFYANKDKDTVIYKQMLKNNLQAHAGHYFGEQEITFHQQNFDKT